MDKSNRQSKAIGAGVGGSLVTLGVWVASLLGVQDIPDEVIAAATTLVAVLLAYYLPSIKRGVPNEQV